MCTFPSAPPALSVFWPWQVLGGWLVVGLFCALIVFLLTLMYYALVRRSFPSRQRELVMGFAVAGYTLALVSAAFLITVVDPSSHALSGWFDTQWPWATAHQCTNDLFATVDLVSSFYASLRHILWMLFFAGLVIPDIALATLVIQHGFVWVRRWLDARSAAR